MQEFEVKFILPGSFLIFKKNIKTIRVPRGTDLLSAAVKCGINISSSCGGEGLCGKCKVSIKNQAILACEHVVESDLVVTVPKESLEIHVKAKNDAEEFTKGVVLIRENFYPYSPLVQKYYLELPRPTADDNISDLDRISRGLAVKIDNLHLSAKLGSVKYLSETLRDSDFKVTVVLGLKDGASEIIAIEPGDTTKNCLGFAFDIGTTTVVGQLVDLNTREILGTRIEFNKQAAYGSDVITRIVFASRQEGLEKTHKAVLSNMNDIIEDLIAACKVNPGDIYAISCAGNMTMMHLLLKIDPTNIRKPPYIPTTAVFPTIHTSELGIETNPKGFISFLPGVSTYVGGDIVSGVLACGLFDDEKLSLLIDIGTNGELVLGNKEWMIGAAASAGPAFEGSGLSCGMKAVKGAVQKVMIDDELDVKCDVIGASKASGICGSGYIDLLCQMLKRGIIDKSGKLDRARKSARIRVKDSLAEFILIFKKDSATGQDIVINEDDIENLKRSKGAIYSAVVALLLKVEKDIKDVKKIYIAGGFGNYINMENAIAIGLLPDTGRECYEFVGNSSLAGARMSLLSAEALRRTDEIAKNITYIDLSAEPAYMDEYIASLFFPHTNLWRFPSLQLSR